MVALYMKLAIKNMVCPRCIMSVEQILKSNGLFLLNIGLGEVELEKTPTVKQLQKLGADLEAVGFELLDDHRKLQIEKIKTLLIEKVQSGEIPDHFSITNYLSSKVYKDYSHLSKLFSEVEGITIEQFFILQKIEKAKEWLVYNEYATTDIAFRLGYSSVQYLSGQFRKITGMSPTEFRKMGLQYRKPLDNL